MTELSSMREQVYAVAPKYPGAAHYIHVDRPDENVDPALLYPFRHCSEDTRPSPRQGCPDELVNVKNSGLLGG